MLTHTPLNFWTKNDRIKILWKHGATYIKYQKSLNLLFMLIQWTVLLETISFLWLFFFSFVEISCTDRLRCQQYSTLPSGFTASAVRMLSLICWTMCGQTFLRRPLTLCRLSWAPLKAWGWESVQARFYNMPYRWGL